MGTRWFSKAEIASWPPGHKMCRGTCGQVLPLADFHKFASGLYGRYTECKGCRRPSSRAQYREQTPEHKLWQRAKSRARRKGLPFELEVSDIVIPDICPVLGTPMDVPSIDQLRPGGGYTKDNVAVISWRANSLKNNATSDELEKIAQWMRDMRL